MKMKNKKFRVILKHSDYLGNKIILHLWEGIDFLDISAIQKAYNNLKVISGSGSSERVLLTLFDGIGYKYHCDLVIR